MLGVRHGGDRAIGQPGEQVRDQQGLDLHLVVPQKQRRPLSDLREVVGIGNHDPTDELLQEALPEVAPEPCIIVSDLTCPEGSNRRRIERCRTARVADHHVVSFPCHRDRRRVERQGGGQPRGMKLVGMRDVLKGGDVRRTRPAVDAGHGPRHPITCIDLGLAQPSQGPLDAGEPKTGHERLVAKERTAQSGLGRTQRTLGKARLEDPPMRPHPFRAVLRGDQLKVERGKTGRKESAEPNLASNDPGRRSRAMEGEAWNPGGVGNNIVRRGLRPHRELIVRDPVQRGVEKCGMQPTDRHRTAARVESCGRPLGSAHTFAPQLERGSVKERPSVVRVAHRGTSECSPRRRGFACVSAKHRGTRHSLPRLIENSNDDSALVARQLRTKRACPTNFDEAMNRHVANRGDRARNRRGDDVDQ